jgi:hypothetical protein
MKCTSLAILLTGVLVACNNPSAKNNAAGESKPGSHVDSLLKDVMDGHDAAMGKMSKLSSVQKKVQHVVDSINKLPEKQKMSSVAYRVELDSLSSSLTRAKIGMDKWMDEFNYDTATTGANREAYLESEIKKVANVKDNMSAALQRADSLLKK